MSTSKPELVPLPVDSPDRRRLPPLLRRAWYGLNQAFRRRIQHLGMTPDQFTALRILLEGKPAGISQRQLTETMTSDPNTIAALLERMEAAGWIERRPDADDRRVNRIAVLPPGRRKYLLARECAVRLQSEVLSALPEGERETFLANLDAVAEACRNAAIQGQGGGRDAVTPTAPPKQRPPSR